MSTVVSATVVSSRPSRCDPAAASGLLRNLGDLERLGLLRRVRVLRACVDLQVGQLGPTERGLGEHAAHSLLDGALRLGVQELAVRGGREAARVDRKSTRLNSSHVKISYAVFCLKKKIN